MSRNRKQNKEIADSVKNINNNLTQISDNIERENNELIQIKKNTDKIVKDTKSPIPLIVTTILGIGAIAATIWGAIYSVHNNDNNSIYDESQITNSIIAAEPMYELYLYSEYSKITIYQENNMTATLNFDTDCVKMTAYLESGKVDTLEMNRKNSEEWGKKVIFNEVGTHEIVAEAVTPEGDTVKYSIKVEVIPVSVDMNIIEDIFQSMD